MKNLNKNKMTAGSFAGCGMFLGSVLLAAAIPAAAQKSPVATPPYTLKVFATAPRGTSQPDSIVQWGDHIIVGFENGVAKDGTDGKSSTIVQFSLSGKVERTFSVPGHNDGLRVVGDDDLWAVQNEDANPNLVVIRAPFRHQKTIQISSHSTRRRLRRHGGQERRSVHDRFESESGRHGK